MKYLILTLLVGTCLSQSLPDAPSHTCGGKPCDGLMYKIAGDRHVELLPTRQGPEGFFHFNDGYHVLHPDKKSWAIVIASNAAMWGAMAVAIKRNPTEKPHSEIPAMAAASGFSILCTKFISPSLGTGITFIATGHYIHSAMQ